MRRGLMCMMLKPRCNRRSGWGKGLLDPPKKDDSFKDQDGVGCVFLIGKALSILNLYHVVRW